MTPWSTQEIQVLSSFLSGNDYLQIGIRKFLDAHAHAQEQSCSSYMATVPRDPERAADCAAKADAYRTLWKILESEVRHRVVTG